MTMIDALLSLDERDRGPRSFVFTHSGKARYQHTYCKLVQAAR